MSAAEGGSQSEVRDRRSAWISLLAAAFIRLLRATVRLRFHGAQTVRAWERDGQRYLLAFWHRHLLLMRYAYRGRRLSVLVSQSRDGELIARVMDEFDATEEGMG